MSHDALVRNGGPWMWNCGWLKSLAETIKRLLVVTYYRPQLSLRPKPIAFELFSRSISFHFQRKDSYGQSERREFIVTDGGTMSHIRHHFKHTDFKILNYSVFLN